MNIHPKAHAISTDTNQFTTDVRALVHATADVADEKISEIRHRIGDALDHEMALCGRVRNKALRGTHAADRAMHQHPYPAIAIGIGLGAAAGCLLKYMWNSPRK